MSFWEYVPYLGEALIVLDLYAVGRALTRGHGVSSTLAWILAIIAFPVVGAVAYLTLARPRLRRTRRRKRVTRQQARDAAAGQLGLRACATELASAEDCAVLRLAARLTGLPATAGTRVQLLAKDQAAFAELGQALRQAEQSILAEYYIIQNDETGHRFLDILAERAAHGVSVRLLYDAVGSLGLDRDRLRAITDAGGRAEAFLPVNPLRRRWAVHLRNHRKLVVVDGKIGFTGGMNVGDEYSGRARRRGGQVFKDTHLKLEGPAVWDLAQIFAEDWTFTTGRRFEVPAPPPPLEDGAIVAVVPSGPDQDHNANAFCYFAGIASARQRCWLQSPYFIPDEPTTRALLTAAMRGVDVRLLVPARCDVRLVGYAARTYYRELLPGGVRVFEYQPSMLHGKTMVVDGAWGIVGSANVDIRSFQLNFELGALVADRRFAALLEQQFEADFAQSREVTRASLAKITPVERLRNGVARLLSPLL